MSILKTVAASALALVVGVLVGIAYEVPSITENSIADTKVQLLERQGVNEVGYTDIMFTADIDPRSEGFTAPQNDTLYASVWFDLSEEPQVIRQGPITEGRYWVHELVTPLNVVTAYIGAFDDGYAGGDFLLVGPGWDGEVPPGMTRVIVSPTNELWDLYRMYSADADDFPTADAERRNIEIVPLSEYVK